jgi:hypothetical protein
MAKDQPSASNVVPFPITAETASATRAAVQVYWAEMERVERLEYAGKKARFNRRISHAYRSALGIGLYFRDLASQ